MPEEKNKRIVKVGDLIEIDEVGSAKVTEVTIDNEGNFIGFKCKWVSK